MPEIFVLSGPDLGSSKSFEAAIVIGRVQGCDLVLHAPSVSRQHARIEPRASAWFAVDLGSSNGLHSAGGRVPELELADGEVFLLGEVELRFRAAAPKVSAKPPALKPAPPPPATVPTTEVFGAADEEETLIELEGDWSDEVTQPVISAPVAGTARPATRKPSPARDDGGRREARAAALRSAGGEGRTAAGKSVLQYNRIEARPGLRAADLGQQSAWLRWVLYGLLAALGAGLAWGAFELSRSLRSDPPVMEIDDGP
jgi:hypothetical protein